MRDYSTKVAVVRELADKLKRERDPISRVAISRALAAATDDLRKAAEDGRSPLSMSGSHVQPAS